MSGDVPRPRGACFICELLRGNPDYAHHIAYRDDVAVVFANRYPSVWGHLLVAPVVHRSGNGDGDSSSLTPAEYAELRRVMDVAGRALRATVPTERLYTLRLPDRPGMPLANHHVHWHLTPVPPGVRHGRAQMVALSGVGQLRPPEAALARLAREVGARIRALMPIA